MTREEERLGAALEFYDKHKSAASNVTLVDSFVYGTKWADEHPKDEMVNLTKARKWLSTNKNNYIIDIEGETIVDDTIIEDFLKAMEE